MGFLQHLYLSVDLLVPASTIGDSPIAMQATLLIVKTGSAPIFKSKLNVIIRTYFTGTGKGTLTGLIFCGLRISEAKELNLFERRQAFQSEVVK